MANARGKIYGAIVAFKQQNGYAPTLRELARLTGHPSTSHISSMLDKLQDEKLIKYDRNVARSIVVIGECVTFPEPPTWEDEP